jgi:glycine dehydrogenase
MVPENLVRKSSFLQYDVFNNHHSESQLMRYIKKSAFSKGSFNFLKN